MLDMFARLSAQLSRLLRILQQIPNPIGQILTRPFWGYNGEFANFDNLDKTSKITYHTGQTAGTRFRQCRTKPS